MNIRFIFFDKENEILDINEARLPVPRVSSNRCYNRKMTNVMELLMFGMEERGAIRTEVVFVCPAVQELDMIYHHEKHKQERDARLGINKFQTKFGG